MRNCKCSLFVQTLFTCAQLCEEQKFLFKCLHNTTKCVHQLSTRNTNRQKSHCLSMFTICLLFVKILLVQPWWIIFQHIEWQKSPQKISKNETFKKSNPVSVRQRFCFVSQKKWPQMKTRMFTLSPSLRSKLPYTFIWPSKYY